MCGLVGVLGNHLYTTHLETFRNLLIFDTIRGFDSTGVAAHTIQDSTKAGTTIIAKAKGTPENLFKSFPEYFESKKGTFYYESAKSTLKWMMGHNRAATAGAVTSYNAHPFRHKHIIGAHNGTLSGQYYYSLPKSDDLKGDTDSERLFYAISQGLSIKEIAEKLGGAFALTWWNSEEQSFNILRNKERSLYYVYDAVRSLMFYASEKWMLEVSLGKSATLKDLVSKIIEVPTQTHLKWTLNASKTISKFESFAYPLEEKKSYSAPAVVGYSGPKSTPNVSEAETTPSWMDKNNKGSGEYRNVQGWLERPTITFDQFQVACKNGCSTCSTSLAYADRVDVKWLDPELPLCKSCAAEWKRK